MHLQQALRTTMRYYKATSAWGVDYYRATRFDSITCAVIIYPLEDGGGIFPEITVDWYTCQEQAERHAQDWRRHGHRVEVVCANSVAQEDCPLSVC
jgi:hypothetical protein